MNWSSVKTLLPPQILPPLPWSTPETWWRLGQRTHSSVTWLVSFLLPSKSCGPRTTRMWLKESVSTFPIQTMTLPIDRRPDWNLSHSLETSTAVQFNIQLCTNHWPRCGVRRVTWHVFHILCRFEGGQEVTFVCFLLLQRWKWSSPVLDRLCFVLLVWLLVSLVWLPEPSSSSKEMSADDWPWPMMSLLFLKWLSNQSYLSFSVVFFVSSGFIAMVTDCLPLVVTVI